jgi:hypothetical protein
MPVYYNDDLDREAEKQYPGHMSPQTPYLQYLAERESVRHGAYGNIDSIWFLTAESAYGH